MSKALAACLVLALATLAACPPGAIGQQLAAGGGAAGGGESIALRLPQQAPPPKAAFPAAATAATAAAASPAGCTLPPETGLCRAAIPRWFWNAADGACALFTFGGCGGNANNFESEGACEAACAPGAPLKVAILPPARAANGAAAPAARGAHAGRLLMSAAAAAAGLTLLAA
ncbi:MAG: hypothetical protein J3K34DRAFT_526667 [Monoraphidium minutum]|nr:MAG: hypothetical protein J3K34DRAFT_526667 [Monoraphidium minutum]